MRTLAEITRTYARDAERHAELLAVARRGEADEDQIRELSRLDGERHRFGRMCRRWAPLSMTELGFLWGETLRKDDNPDVTFIVHEAGLVHFEDKAMPLEQVCTALAARGMRVSLGGWIGSAGTVGDLAGLKHPAADTSSDGGDGKVSKMTDAGSTDDADRRPDESREAGPEMPAAPEKKKKAPAVGGNYDLFG